MKKCNLCKKEKSFSEFYMHKSGKFGRNPLCKACISIKNKQYPKERRKELRKKWISNSSEYERNQALRKKFGITLTTYKEFLSKQGERCAICLRHQGEFDRQLAVDHCHKTGKIRGLLCGNCNNGIGRFYDDPQKLKIAAQYLEKHK